MNQWRRVARIRTLALALVLAAFAVGPPSTATAAPKRVVGVVNLNTAPVETLALLPGIGPSRARDIIAWRTRRPFRTVDELVRVRGIGRRMLQAIRPNLAIAGPSTLKALPRGAAPPSPLATVGSAAPGPPAAAPKPKPITTCRSAAHTPSVRRPAPTPAPPQSFANHCSPPP